LSAEGGGNTVEYTDSNSSLAFAAGYTVLPNLSLYLDFLIAGAVDADIQLNGGGANPSRLGTNIFGIGPGAAYYFGSNFFVATAFLLGQVEVTDSNDQTLYESRTGLLFEALAGKEWWALDN